MSITLVQPELNTDFVNVLLCFLPVLTIPLIIVLLEILKTFKTDFIKALRCSSTWMLVAVNTFLSIVIYLIACGKFDQYGKWEIAFLVGIGFPSLICSRFSLFRAVGAYQGESKEPLDVISLELDKAYGTLQKFCMSSIDTSLADERLKPAEKLLELFEQSRFTAEQIVERIELYIISRLTDSEENLKYLNEFKQSCKGDERKLVYGLGLFLRNLDRKQMTKLVSSYSGLSQPTQTIAKS
jgi:hypothetical protein